MSRRRAQGSPCCADPPDRARRLIHFVYAVPPAARGLLRLLEPHEPRLISWLPWLAPTWRFGILAPREDVLRAPWSITMNLYRYLASRCPTRLYHLTEQTTIDYGPDDVVLGHPWYEAGRVMERALLDQRPCRLKALIFPIHHGLPAGTGPEDNTYAMPLVEMADLVLGIMGPYWYDTLGSSRFASWRDKVVRLDMAVDTHQYPRIKYGFNPPGRRGFLYIGSSRPLKGPDVLAKTMSRLGDYRRGWIGYGDEIPHVPRLAAGAELTATFMQQVAGNYDIFVNTSLSDANPTTILEAMAWGFPVACTPQSGYYKMPTVVELSTTDIDANVRRLLELQLAPEDRLQSLADQNRSLVETEYSWDRFCATVWRQIEPHLAEAGSTGAPRGPGAGR